MMNICSYISGRAWESQWQSSSEWWSWQSLIIKMMIIIVMMKICSYISGRAWESDGSWQLRLHLGLFHICPVSELLWSASSSLWSWWWWWKGAWGEGGEGGANGLWQVVGEEPPLMTLYERSQYQKVEPSPNPGPLLSCVSLPYRFYLHPNGSFAQFLWHKFHHDWCFYLVNLFQFIRKQKDRLH